MPVYMRLFLVVMAFCASCATQEPPLVEKPIAAQVKVKVTVAANIPKRQAGALSGTAFSQKLLGANEQQREQFIIEEYRKGNIPDYLREFTKVRFLSQTRSGKRAEVTLFVLPDYLGVGTNQDFLRTPMTPLSAQIIANQYGLLLPTVKIVDVIYRAAGIKLDPQPFKPGPNMVTVAELVRHNKVIQTSLHNQFPKGLVAGHKKDIVITNLLLKKLNRVAIYGWHLRSGTAIQPLTTVHGSWYADYSHGVRLLAATMIINNAVYKVSDVLQNPELAALISYEGPLKILRYKLDSVPIRKKWWPQS